jgi:uncharacterized protein (DUF433 family)
MEVASLGMLAAVGADAEHLLKERFGENVLQGTGRHDPPAVEREESVPSTRHRRGSTVNPVVSSLRWMMVTITASSRSSESTHHVPCGPLIVWTSVVERLVKAADFGPDSTPQGHRMVVELAADDDFPLVALDVRRRGGQPVIKGRNIRASTIAELVAAGESHEDIAEWYDLTVEQIDQAGGLLPSPSADRVTRIKVRADDHQGTEEQRGKRQVAIPDVMTDKLRTHLAR